MSANPDPNPSQDEEDRLAMLAADLQTYGTALAAQRRADLAGTDPSFLAQLRK